MKSLLPGIRVLSMLLGLALSQCATPHYPMPGYGEYYSIQDVFLYPFHNQPLTYLHLITDSTLAGNASGQILVTPDKPMGTIEYPPAITSQQFQNTLDSAETLYDQRHYAEAAALLEPAVEAEPNNPFLRNALARAYFWIDTKRGRTYELYKKLVAFLDTQVKEELRSPINSLGEVDTNTVIPADINTVVIDLWFAEAYWKLGCLQLDRRE